MTLFPAAPPWKHSARVRRPARCSAACPRCTASARPGRWRRSDSAVRAGPRVCYLAVVAVGRKGPGEPYLQPAPRCPGTSKAHLGASLCIGREEQNCREQNLPPTSAHGKRRGAVWLGACALMGIRYEAVGSSTSERPV